ncbi:MAG TPA: hypothetical protein VK097_12520 [Lentibacillus sp.]|uniref:hypothetical protein n=1 Tax=Lentibacillus sp. TaxID=1925746 RepID=UPI002B4AAF27|nr:hypothetical protein [Lentibacillus sp.]HLR63248.1 hypothetical protein [Lentibacillus sp.]
MNRRKVITAITGLVILVVAVTFVVDTEDPKSQNKDVISHDYTFTGESENWSAVFEVEGKEVFYEEEEVLKLDSNANSAFELMYKGSLEELSSVSRMRYEYVTPNSVMERTTNSPPNETFFTDRGNDLVRQEAVIKVTVEWDGSTETFTMEAEE